MDFPCSGKPLPVSRFSKMLANRDYASERPLTSRTAQEEMQTMEFQASQSFSFGTPNSQYAGGGNLGQIQQALQQAQQLENQLLSGQQQGDVLNTSPQTMSQIGNLANQILSLLQELVGDLEQGQGQGGNGDQYFNNASGSDTGDPHLSFNGQQGGYANPGFNSGNFGTPATFAGQNNIPGGNNGQVSAKWNDMNSEPDLLNSDSFGGGLQVSSQVTQPNSNGVTYNQSMTVNVGGDAIQVNGDGSVDINGQQVQLQAGGQPIQLGNGVSLSENSNGQIQVNAQNGYGGQLNLNFNPNGGHVDMTFNANNCDLGGAMVNQAEGNSNPSPVLPQPIMQPIDISLNTNLNAYVD